MINTATATPRPMLLATILALILIVGMAATATKVGAHSDPTCPDSTYSHCVELYMDHWFDDLEADDDTDGQGTRANPVKVNDDGSIGLERDYHIYASDHNIYSRGRYKVRVRDAHHEWMLRGSDNGYRHRESISVSSDIDHGDGTASRTFQDVDDVSGRAYHRFTVTFRVQVRQGSEFRDDDPTFTMKRSRTDSLHFVDDRCDPPDDRAEAHLRVTYLENRDDGGLSDNRIGADYPNPLTCANAPMATDGTAAGVYQRQVCRGSDCTAPMLIGTGVSSSSMKERHFNAGVRELDGAEPSGTTYHVMSRKGDLGWFNTGSTSFTKAQWDGNSALRKRFSEDADWSDHDETEVFYLLTTCSGFSCGLPEAVRGREMASRITQ